MIKTRERKLGSGSCEGGGLEAGGRPSRFQPEVSACRGLPAGLGGGGDTQQ